MIGFCLLSRQGLNTSIRPENSLLQCMMIIIFLILDGRTKGHARTLENPYLANKSS